ncbi:MAG TPA: hypothetical protein VHO67_05115 [Polyangia bacterium]|nr:hypothetical protein [Polyangia bacterium]
MVEQNGNVQPIRPRTEPLRRVLEVQAAGLASAKMKIGPLCPALDRQNDGAGQQSAHEVVAPGW